MDLRIWRVLAWAAPLWAALLLAGCATGPAASRPVPRYTPQLERRVPRPVPPPVVAREAPAVHTNASGIKRSSTEDYAARKLQPGDKLTLSLMGIGPQSPPFQAVVDELGNLNLPYINDIHVGGKTKSEAEKMIETAYKDAEIYKNVTVMILPPEVEYYVRGEVKRPGGYPLGRDLTFLQALAEAGGYTEFADPTSVKGIRGTQTFYINAPKIEKGSQKDQYVRPGDIVVVPRGIM